MDPVLLKRPVSCGRQGARGVIRILLLSRPSKHRAMTACLRTECPKSGSRGDEAFQFEADRAGVSLAAGNLVFHSLPREVVRQVVALRPLLEHLCSMSMC